METYIIHFETNIGLSQLKENKFKRPHIYPLLIEQDLCECQNISIKFPFTLLVYLSLSFRDIPGNFLFPLYVVIGNIAQHSLLS